jgi:phage FluMu protein Com
MKLDLCIKNECGKCGKLLAYEDFFCGIHLIKGTKIIEEKVATYKAPFTEDDGNIVYFDENFIERKLKCPKCGDVINMVSVYK